MLGSNLGNAIAHTTKNLPLILAGGNYRHAGHVAFDSNNNKPLANAFVTIMHGMGIALDSFASSTGTLAGIQVGG